MNRKNKSKLKFLGTSNYKHKKDSMLIDVFGILSSVLTVFFVVYFFKRNMFASLPIVFGDGAVPNINSTFAYVFSRASPWIDVLYIISFHLVRSIFGLIYNMIGLAPMLVMPVSMYFLLKKLEIGLPGRIAGSILYVVNPTVLIWGGLEYGGPLFFLPIIAVCVILYNEKGRIIYLLDAGILLLLFETFLGVASIKLLIPFLAIFIILLFIKALKEKRIKVLTDISIWIVFTGIISLPLLINITGAYADYSTAFSSSSSLYETEKGIVQYAFQSSNILNSFIGLNAYPSTPYLRLGFINSFSEMAWILIVLFSIVAALLYKGRFKLFYRLMLLLLAFLIFFQYGVFTGKLLWLYHDSFVVIYNYPLFFDEMQMFIYAVFFATLIELIISKLGASISDKKSTLQLLSKNRAKVISIVAVMLVLFASFPIVEHSNGDGSLGANPKIAEMPAYWDSIINDLPTYQNCKALVLPNNGTTLTYLDSAMPYLNVYGLPYNFQAFPTEFPNVTVFRKLGDAFVSGNAGETSNLLINQGIGIILVLNPNKNTTITLTSTTINGGGHNFAQIINATGMYTIVKDTTQFIIYKYNYKSNNYTMNTQNFQRISNNYENFSSSSPNIYITTSKYSHISVPIIFSEPNLVFNGTYDQKIFINKNTSGNLNKNFSNIYFAYPNGTLIPAWIQSINSTGATIWLRLSANIKEIYLWIFPKYYNTLSSQGFMGESPLLSPIYGEYDNGINVFTLYDNFSPSSDTFSLFYNSGNTNYTIDNGVYLKSGSQLNSYIKLGNGTLFGLVDYETPSTFGRGGANVAHGIYLYDKSGNLAGIMYDTYDQAMYLFNSTSFYLDPHFHFNNLYNFSLNFNNNIGKISLGNVNHALNITHSSSISIILQNQESNGNSGTIYIPYIAYSNTNYTRNYIFGTEFIQQSMFNNVKIGNPGNLGVPIQFNAYSLNIADSLNFTWFLNGNTYYGNNLNYTFSSTGVYHITLKAYNPETNITIIKEYNETIIPRINLHVNINTNGNYNYTFKSYIYNGTGLNLYLWYVNGVLLNTEKANITYSFSQGGNYTIMLYVMDSGGGKAVYKTYVTVPLKNVNHEKANIWMVAYNLAILPIAFIFFTRRYIGKGIRSSIRVIKKL